MTSKKGSGVPARSRSRRAVLLGGGAGSVVAINIFQASRLATESAQVIQFRAPYLRRAHEINFIYHAGALRENSLDALAEADFAYRKAGLRPTAARNDDAFERLQALFFAFFDLHLDANGIARPEVRQVGALGLGKKLFNN